MLKSPRYTSMDTANATSFIEYNDSDGNYTDYNVTTDCSEDLEIFYSVFQPALYIMIFLLGVTGNSLMITVLLRRRRRLRISEIYLLHLALADLMLLFTIPFQLVSCFTGWMFGVFLCMLKGVLTEMNLFCGSLLLACIGFDRYLAIVHAIPSMQSRRPGTVHLTCISLWVLCLLLSLPNAVFLSVNETNTSQLDCFHYRFEVHAHNWVVANRILKNMCFFFSLVVMSFCYSALAITLSKSKKSQAKKGAIRLAVLVTLVFCLCWLPYNITSLIRTIVEMGYMNSECAFNTLLYQVYDVTQTLGISHCCLNPLLYAVVGVQFRNELVQLLCQLGCGRICLPFIRAEGHSRQSISEGTNSTNFNY
ncbi:C-X-C chemokine receptor type 5 [Melanotaenia boesemani]|uniref:C-X-C chemokine receptor type 5 n=1 Tax=Melanotaenia boesemani TaxID=1250792 RepID=UPI001C03EACA|nr:C-X-C chemokine receptor type 5 [Melanotaenia boesemani]